jgi:hypothetical protein
VQASKYQKPGKTLTSRDEAASRLRELLGSVVAQLASISEQDAGLPRIAGKWSPKQILGHLIDSASNNHQRFVRAEVHGMVKMPGYTQAEWVSVQHYQDRKWTEIVLLWSSFNRHLLHIMETAPAESLGAPCEIDGDESGTLEFLMVDYVCHLEHHLDQILGD